MYKIEANEIVWTTFYTIHKIREFKNWWDMLLLYFAYIEQSRIQETNKTWSLDIFMCEKMNRWKDRFRNAKNWLKELWLIDILQVKWDDWKIKTWYVKTNFIINDQKIRNKNMIYEVETTNMENQTAEIPYTGETETNALSIKNKCLKNIKENNNKKIFISCKEDIREIFGKEERQKILNELNCLWIMIELWHQVEKDRDKIMGEIQKLREKVFLFWYWDDWDRVLIQFHKWKDWRSEWDKKIKKYRASINQFLDFSKNKYENTRNSGNMNKKSSW